VQVYCTSAKPKQGDEEGGESSYRPSRRDGQPFTSFVDFAAGRPNIEDIVASAGAAHGAVYVCGPEQMSKTVVSTGIRLGVAVHSETFNF